MMSLTTYLSVWAGSANATSADETENRDFSPTRFTDAMAHGEVTRLPLLRGEGSRGSTGTTESSTAYSLRIA
jgi:hypothetical protein